VKHEASKRFSQEEIHTQNTFYSALNLFSS